MKESSEGFTSVSETEGRGCCHRRGDSLLDSPAGLKGAAGGVHFGVWHTHASDDSKMQKEMEFSVAYVSWNRFVCVCVCV